MAAGIIKNQHWKGWGSLAVSLGIPLCLESIATMTVVHWKKPTVGWAKHGIIGVGTNMRAELVAILKGVELCVENNFFPIWLESDSLVALKIIQSPFLCLELRNLVLEIKHVDRIVGILVYRIQAGRVTTPNLAWGLAETGICFGLLVLVILCLGLIFGFSWEVHGFNQTLDLSGALSVLIMAVGVNTRPRLRHAFRQTLKCQGYESNPAMPMSPKVFHYRSASRFRRFSSSSAFPLICLIFGLAGVLFGLFSITRPARKCPDVEPRAVSFMWDRNEGGGAGGGVAERHKVMGFVGIQTGFGSVGRRWAIRQTWLPADRQGLLRLEEATGLAFRFVIGKTKDKSKMAALQTEVNEYDDFMLIDIEEEYSNLPYKTLAFFKAAFALYDSDFYVKADDDIYLRPDRLSLLLAKERPTTQTYLGCMKKGPVFTDPHLKWLVRATITPAWDRILSSCLWSHICTFSRCGVELGCTEKQQASYKNSDAENFGSTINFRMFSNEDVTIGSWMLAMNVNHENNLALCEPDCSSSSIAVWDIPRCSGLCNPEVKMLQLHKKEICSGIPKSSDE
ncbi:hypothetical protein ZIOFF_000843 [Zingiber officinale]|uniref:RNase H type-1 domain-containing protein n=1 Tax=Zingiber officinale TaxID=94328 RepID=A0A8J5LRN3_ZINOF|nr:hypothetical protein ZIOFF_000843 [Zingiber officinale]